MMKRLIVFILFWGILFSCCSKEKQKKVLIIGIDGCRPDAFIAAKTPNIDLLLKTGAYSYHAKTDPISSSGICWTSMLTGVWHEKHNVTTNEYKNPNVSEYPHFFRKLKETNKDIKTVSIVNWEPIHKILQEVDADICEHYSPDEKVAERAAEILLEKNPDAMFIQLDDVDHAGHTYDFSPTSPDYLLEIEKSDSLTGIIVNSIKKRPSYKDEDWLIIVTTDHGGSNFGHGKDIPEHTTIFYIVNGSPVQKGEIKDSVFVVDVAVTALDFLGYSPRKTWNLDGNQKGLIRKK